MKCEFKANAYEDRRTLAAILAEAGYKVVIEKRPENGYSLFRSDYYIVVETEATEEKTITNKVNVETLSVFNYKQPEDEPPEDIDTMIEQQLLKYHQGDAIAAISQQLLRQKEKEELYSKQEVDWMG